ncbi:MAG: hypothetical protein K2O40_14815, partial [Lachnospiraceae bacterium]|nr:hypothetical protein [Lachnospiraceae bacterium]
MKRWMQNTHIVLILVCIFLLIVLLSVNMCYFDRQLSQNDSTRQEQNEVIGLSGQLVKTSSNLSYYMRNYVTAGNLECLSAYWNLEKGPDGRQAVLKSMAAYEHSRSEREKGALLREDCEKLQEYEMFFLQFALKRFQVDAESYEGIQPLKSYIIDTQNYILTDTELNSGQDGLHNNDGLIKNYHEITDEVVKELWELSMLAEDGIDELDRQSERIKRQIFMIQTVSLVLASICVFLLTVTKIRSRTSAVSGNIGEGIHSHRKQQQRDEMLMYFSRAYFEVYVVDLSQGSYEIIRSTEQYGNYIRNLTGDFAQLMEMAVVSWTKPPYREIFSQLLNTEEIKRRFASGEKKIEFVYESYDAKWKRLESFPETEYGTGNEKMIFSL